MTKTFGLTHLAIAVKDIGKTLDFYTRVFEMEVMYREDKMIQLTTPGNHDILVFEKKSMHHSDNPGVLPILVSG